MALLLVLTACGKPQVAVQGKSGTVATYKLSTLSTVFSPDVRVPTVIAATEQTVRDRGYSVVASAATDDAGRLVARPPRSDSYPRIVVISRRIAAGTELAIEVQPLGDQELSRSLLDGILQRLGM